MADDIEGKEPSLKETDPIKYYKRVRAWCRVGYWCSIILPMAIVIIIYCCTHAESVDKVKFPLGIGMAIVWAVVIALVEVVRANKEKKGDYVKMIPISLGFINWFVASIVLYLLYITMYYLIILLLVEGVGQFGASIFAYFMKKADTIIKDESKYERQSNAELRVKKAKSNNEGGRPID